MNSQFTQILCYVNSQCLSIFFSKINIRSLNSYPALRYYQKNGIENSKQQTLRATIIWETLFGIYPSQSKNIIQRVSHREKVFGQHIPRSTQPQTLVFDCIIFEIGRTTINGCLSFRCLFSIANKIRFGFYHQYHTIDNGKYIQSQTNRNSKTDTKY